MQNWIFVVTNQKAPDGDLTGREILDRRMEDKFWGLGEKTPNRKALRAGDNVLFYVGAPESAFAASAKLASESINVGDTQRQQLSHGKSIFRADYGVHLDNPIIWKQTKPVAELAPTLEFIGKRPDWWVFLQGGVRGISDADYARIIGPSQIAETKEKKANGIDDSEHLFALEKHLEDFIEKNWSKINWGRKLALYASDAGNGRQFPAGDWNIDFLAKADSGAFVVVELKRGRSSDDAVGQVLRYISWVRENVAQPSQPVEGIIVCSEVDNELRYAVRELKNISVMQYRVSFALNEVKM